MGTGDLVRGVRRRTATGIARADAGMRRAGGRFSAEVGGLVALGLTTCWAGLLRLEALVAGYGALPGPHWWDRLQSALVALAGHLRPERIVWNVASVRSGDPLAYLQHGREIAWLYEARTREPVFNYATSWALWLTGDADIGVNLASAIFSLLCVPAVYLLGRLTFGRTAGLIAAILVAVDPNMIQWGVGGWRDDAFTFSFLLFLCAAVAFSRSPDRPRALGLGLASAMTMLTRLTALSFVAPVLLLLGIRAWQRGGEQRRARLRQLAVAAVIAVVLVSPYLVTCWVELGDPLIAINRNTRYYRERAGENAAAPMDAFTYLRDEIEARPVRMTDQVLRGFTSYAFENKWHGLQQWSPRLRRGARLLAILGVMAWMWVPAGRLLLVGLLTSLLPYVFTWELSSAWRFTMHAYPVYLLAAASTFSLLARAMRRSRPAEALDQLAYLLPRATASFALLALIVATPRWLAPRRMAESLRAGEPVTVAAGEEDRAVFGGDWYPPYRRDGLTLRLSRGTSAGLRLPLVPRRPYRLRIRVFRAGRVPGRFRIAASVRDTAIGRCNIKATADNWCSFRVPRRVLQDGAVVVLRSEKGIPVRRLDPPLAAAGPREMTSFGVSDIRIVPGRPRDRAGSGSS